MAKNRKNPKRTTVQVAAIIPARGGQQNIPYKNLQQLGDKTLLGWAAEVAFTAKNIDVVLVSTEDQKIAAAAASLGAIVIPRPPEFSRPDSGDAGFYTHAVKWMEKEHGWTPDLLVNLRPTSPLRFPEDIDAMVGYMKEHGEADGLKSVIPTPLHPYKMWSFATDDDQLATSNKRIGDVGRLVPVFDNEYRKTHGPDQPRQKIQERFPVYFQDGQIDITRRQFILRPECLKYDNVWGGNLHGYVLDPRTSTDLDTKEDFHRAEKLYEQLRTEQGKQGK